MENRESNTLKLYLGPQGGELKRQFRRVAQLRGASMNGLVAAYLRRVVREEQRRNPQVFDLLTEAEEVVLEAIEEANHELEQIAEYTGREIEQTRQTLQSLVRRELIEVRARGGRVARSHGAAKIPLYFLVKK